MIWAKLALWYDLVDLIEKFLGLSSPVNGQGSIAVHQFAILCCDVKLMLAIKFRKQGHRCTLVNFACHEVMTLELPESTVLVRRIGIIVVHLPTVDLIPRHSSWIETGVVPHMNTHAIAVHKGMSCTPGVALVNVVGIVLMMIGHGTLQELAYFVKVTLGVVVIVDTDSDPVATIKVSVFTKIHETIVQIWRGIESGTVGHDLHATIPQTVDAVYPVTHCGIQQGLTAHDDYFLETHMLAPLMIYLLIISPKIMAAKIMIVEAIAIVTGKIAHIGDIEFHVGQVCPDIVGKIVNHILTHYDRLTQNFLCCPFS